jgi:hypothetical protein
LRHCNGRPREGQFIGETKINGINNLVATLQYLWRAKNAFKNKDLQRNVKGSGEESAYFACSGRAQRRSGCRAALRHAATEHVQAKLNSIAPSGP